MNKLLLGTAVVAVMALSVPVQADILTFETTLSGPAESPPNNSPGTGTSTVLVNTDANEYTIQFEFENLIGGSTAAHIHCCNLDPVTNRASVATQLPTFPGFPAGITEGIYNNTFSLLAESTYNQGFIDRSGGTVEQAAAAFIAGLESGIAYLNIHSTEFPGGEIRGFYHQIQTPTPVPEPASLALLGAALVGLGFARRRETN